MLLCISPCLRLKPVPRYCFGIQFVLGSRLISESPIAFFGKGECHAGHRIHALTNSGACPIQDLERFNHTSKAREAAGGWATPSPPPPSLHQCASVHEVGCTRLILAPISWLLAMPSSHGGSGGGDGSRTPPAVAEAPLHPRGALLELASMGIAR